ncbi:Trimeric GatFAB AmidoTransferase(AdT) complex subunit [Arachnomyces sp. PD_36]|nr:Trimeric GatFAB AmidoTransferase(AdT) complex subunit [Arachnomyces sp. PD_36]
MSLLREAEKCLASQKTYATLNAFITPLQRSGPWLERVKDAEARSERGTPTSKIDGKLVAIKDNICTRELPTTCASGILNKYTSPYNATVVDTLENAGAVVGGKTNLDEFGMGSHSTHSYFEPVKNAVGNSKDDISAGGSSGGSAVAVATGQCYAALGTDTGGSVRLPAAYTGTVGFKPSYGLISRWGVVAYANSLDTVGVIGQTTSTVKDVFNVLNHYDRRDPTNIPQESRSRILKKVKDAASRRRKQLRIGVPSEYNIHELTPSVRDAWRNTLEYLRKQGHSIHPVSLPATKQALSAYYVLAPAEASSNLAKYDGVRYGTRPEQPDNSGGYLYANTRGTGFGVEVKRRILLGAFSLSADAIENYFIQAQKVRRLVQRDFDRVLSLSNPLSHGEGVEKSSNGVDVLVCPTAPSPPPTLASLESGSAVDAYMNDVFTVPASLAGLPALSVPVATGDKNVAGGGPVGVQVIGQYGDDDLVLDVGKIIEGMD